MLGVLACSGGLRVYVLASSRAWRVYVLACLRAWRVCVLTCFRAWRAWCAYMLGVLTCLAGLACLRAWCACLCTCVLFMMKRFIFLRVCVLGVVFCLICFTSQYLNLKILTAKTCVLC